MYLLVASALFCLIPFCQSARILGIVSTPSYSHQVPFQPLWKELSLRGHQVTVLTTDPVNDASLKNLTEINLHGTYEIWKKRINMIDMSTMNPVEIFNQYTKAAEHTQDYQLSQPEVQKLLKDDSQRFDLLMMEPHAAVMHAFAEKFNCPFIHIFSLDATFSFYYLIGNSAHPALYPDTILPYAAPLSFFERLISSLFVVYLQHFFIPRTLTDQQALVAKHFGPEYSNLEDIMKNVSLIFVNTDNIFHSPRPLLPSIIQIGGGTHLKPLKPLPKNLKSELDKATQGVIYWSFGSNVKSKDLSDEKRNIMLEVLSELPYLVLWKFELEDLSNKPDNVIIAKWFPQQDVLRHPNIKLFITQGGLQSLEEAVYSGVPIVGIPFVSDQHSNIKRMTQKKIGVTLDYSTLTKKLFKNAILEVINNSKYGGNARKMGELAQDQPMRGIDKAIWWAEYVIRHKGASHLRSPAVDLPLYQYFLLDVIAFCLFILFIAVYVLYILIRLSFRLITYLKSSKIKSE